MSREVNAFLKIKLLVSCSFSAAVTQTWTEKAKKKVLHRCSAHWASENWRKVFVYLFLDLLQRVISYLGKQQITKNDNNPTKNGNHTGWGH